MYMYIYKHTYISVQKILMYITTYKQLGKLLSVTLLYLTPASPSFLRGVHQKVQIGQ